MALLRRERAVTCRWRILILEIRRGRERHCINPHPSWRRHGQASWWRLCLGIVWLVGVETEFDYVTFAVLQRFKVKWSEVKVTAWKRRLIATLLLSRGR